MSGSDTSKELPRTGRSAPFRAISINPENIPGSFATLPVTENVVSAMVTAPSFSRHGSSGRLSLFSSSPVNAASTGTLLNTPRMLPVNSAPAGADAVASAMVKS